MRVTVEELLEKRGQLTDEELAFLERELVKMTCDLHAIIKDVQAEIAEDEPQLSAKLGRHADVILENVRAGAALPWPNGMPGALAD